MTLLTQAGTSATRHTQCTCPALLQLQHGAGDPSCTAHHEHRNQPLVDPTALPGPATTAMSCPGLGRANTHGSTAPARECWMQLVGRVRAPQLAATQATRRHFLVCSVQSSARAGRRQHAAPSQAEPRVPGRSHKLLFLWSEDFETSPNLSRPHCLHPPWASPAASWRLHCHHRSTRLLAAGRDSKVTAMGTCCCPLCLGPAGILAQGLRCRRQSPA